MTFSKKPNRSSTALPRIEPKGHSPKRVKKATPSHLPSASSQHLPSITRRKHHTKPSHEKSTESLKELMKTYEELLKEVRRNETLIDNKRKETEYQMQEMETLLELAEVERKEVEKVTLDHTEATKKLNDIDLENARVMARESEQGHKIAELEGTNNEMRSELRTLMNQITDTKNRFEGGPDYIKEEIERFQREACELEKENEVLDVKINRKRNELNDLRIELIMVESDSEDDSNDGTEDTFQDDEQPEEPLTDAFDRITPPLIISEPSTTHDMSLDVKLTLGGLNDLVTLPSIKPRDTCVKKPKLCQTVLRSHLILPAIDGININSHSANPSECSRNILHRGTSATTRMPHLPKPPASSKPPTALARRRRMKRS